MLGMLPFITLFLAILLSTAWRGRTIDALLYAVIGWGVYLALISEVLGALGWLRFAPILAAWGLPVLALAAGLLRQGWRRLAAWPFAPPFSPIERLILIVAGLFIGVLLVIAWVAPPNNNDALAYHLPRVMHWAQNGSLAHYPVAYEFQLHNAIWAELVILHTFILGGTDQFANLVQWLSLVGCLALAVGIAAQLGAGRVGRLLAAVFVLTIPMGILQASAPKPIMWPLSG
jgi:hypothetical protein